MTKKNSPTHTAYTVREFKNSKGEEDASWTRIGSVWAHGDNVGFTVRIDASPVNGEIVIRPVKEKKASGDAVDE